MRHLRKDWDSIQPTSGTTGIREDEPVFLLRAKDPVAALVVAYWADLAADSGTDEITCSRVHEWSQEMHAYRLKHFPDKKFPDVPEGQLRASQA